MISGFMDGLDIIPGTSAGDMFGNATTYMGNGYELVRQLTREYSLRNRAECLSLRTQLLAKVFSSSATDGAVTHVIRQIEYSVARYTRMMSTVLGGLRIEDGDMLTMLVRSLPSAVRDYALMHAQAATYPGFKQAARWYENQHRLFKELNPGKKAVFGVVGIEETGDPSPNAEGIPEDSGTVNAVNSYNSALRCAKCARKEHTAQNCPAADMSKIKCYNCGPMGHVSSSCKSPQKAVPGKGTPPVTKGSGKSKGKGNSKGGGKKGKMFAICDDAGNWWYSECGDATEPEGSGQQVAAAPHEENEQSVLVLSSLIPSFVPDVTPKDMGPMPKLDVCAHPDRTWEIEELYDSNWNAREFVWSTVSGMDKGTGSAPVVLALRQEGIQSESCKRQRYIQLEKTVLRAPSEGSCVSGQEGIHSESWRWRKLI
eukprot:s178_g45.t1